jgi:large subunit ribosomal protein L13
MIKTRPVKASEIKEQWFIIDAADQAMGRVASNVAELLMGKHDPLTALADYHIPQVKVIVTNASKLNVTEKKAAQKTYTQYSGFPGGLRVDTLGKVMKLYPERAIENAVWGMLPKNKRGRAIYKNLFVYAGATHPHEAQQPKSVVIQK